TAWWPCSGGGAEPQRTTVHLNFAGVGSGPPLPTALTWSLCLPGFTVGLKLFPHFLNFLASSLHWNLAPASSAVNLNFAFLEFVFSFGCFLILVCGGIPTVRLTAATPEPLQDAVCPVKTNLVEQPSLSVTVSVAV